MAVQSSLVEELRKMVLVTGYKRANSIAEENNVRPPGTSAEENACKSRVRIGRVKSPRATNELRLLSFISILRGLLGISGVSQATLRKAGRFIFQIQPYASMFYETTYTKYTSTLDLHLRWYLFAPLQNQRSQCLTFQSDILHF